MFTKGDKVRDIYTDDVFVVKCVCWQNYGTRTPYSPTERDQTVTFEPAMHMGLWQETPWNRGSNLQLITD